MFKRITSGHRTCSPACADNYLKFSKSVKAALRLSTRCFRTRSFECKHCQSIVAPQKSNKATRYCSKDCKSKAAWKRQKQDGRAALFRKRKLSNPAYRLAKRLRGRLWELCRKRIAVKYDSALELCGCSPEQLRQIIENKFRNGMTWDNYGTVWEIDHIRPIASFNLFVKEDQRQCFHYTNLQPLLAWENRRKSDSVQQAA